MYTASMQKGNGYSEIPQHKSIQPESEPPVFARLLSWLEKLNQEQSDLISLTQVISNRLNVEPELAPDPRSNSVSSIVQGSGALQNMEMMISHYSQMVDVQRNLLRKLDRLI